MPEQQLLCPLTWDAAPKINFLTHTTWAEAVTLRYSLLFSPQCGTHVLLGEYASQVCTFAKKSEGTLSGHHPSLCSLIILAFFLPNIEVSLSRSVSFTSLPFSPLQWFDVPNHFQPWTPHERQQALAVIGCWKNGRGRGQKTRRGGTLEKGKRGRSREERRLNEKRDEASALLVHIFKVPCYH